jgi:hypothetical protein
MARLKKYMLLKKLGMVPAPLTAEQMEQIEAYCKHEVERAKLTRRWLLTPYQMAWLWREPERLRQRARAAVALLIEVRDTDGSGREMGVSAKRTSGSRPPRDKKEPRLLADNPFQVLLENFNSAGRPKTSGTFWVS